MYYQKYDQISNREESDFLFSAPLSTRVLVLNNSYEPLALCSAKKAVTLLFLDKATLVSSLDDKYIRTVSKAFAFPSVIRLYEYIHMPFRKVEISRKNILRRDSYQCQYCGQRHGELTIDHIIPKSRGGSDSWDNLITSCKSCNNIKGDMTPEEAEMPLLNKAIKPHYIIFMQNFLADINKDWRPFLFMD